jgi:serine protein kinase
MDDIFKKIDEHTQKYRVSHWEGTFRDYLPMVLENPKLAQLAHARIYDMVRSYGVDIDDQGNERFQFFTRELFGIDETFGGWTEAQRVHFSDGGEFDRIYGHF